MTQSEQSDQNKKAWEYRAYEHWAKNYGLPEVTGPHIKAHPEERLLYYLEELGNVNGKKIACLLGSGGIRAVSLAVLGAEVTIVDISSGNAKYALELAREAGVEINYIISDVFDINMDEMNNKFDIVFMEFGILHYFSDLYRFASLTYDILKPKGTVILRDFHPISSKLISVSEQGEALITDNYFNDELIENPVAYQGLFPQDEQDCFPKTFLRKWTISEVISSFAEAGYNIRRMKEEPHKLNLNIPANYMISAIKYDNK